ncbi:Uncharacterised protein [uncultured archaeon]|nr:Uncharacterised protein [uncultured archaeon]
MRKIFALLLFACVAAASNMTVLAPVKSVTAYSNGYAFVSRDGQVSFPQGETTFHIINFTPSALSHSITPQLAASGSRISEHYVYSMSWKESANKTEYFSLERLLNASVGKTISFMSGNDSVDGTLVWFGEGMVGVAASGGQGVTVYKVSDLKRVTLPATNYSEVVQVNTTKSERGLAVTASGASGSGRLSASYISAGAEWAASYKYYIQSEADSGTGLMQGRATVSNGAGEDWENITLKLVVGNPRIVPESRLFYYSYDRVKTKDYAGGIAPIAAESSFNQFTPTQVSAYYVYSLSVPATIRSGEERTLPLLENNVTYKRELFWDTYQSMPEKVFILNNTGGESWAEGVVGVYLNGEFLGESTADYTPRGKEARITVSDMPDIKVKKETLNQSSTATTNSRTTVYKIRLTIENGMSERAKIRVNDHMYSGDQVTLISSNPSAEQKPENVLEWKPEIAAGGSQEIVYEYSVTNFFTDSRLPY